MHPGKFYHFILSFVLSSILLSCDDSLNPSAPFTPRMVIYSILTTQSDTQYVRVYASYNPTDNNPSSNTSEVPVTDALVTIRQGNMAFTFRDTIVRRADKSRYDSDIHIYYCYPMKVESNKSYTLQVSSPIFGSASAQLTVPNRADLNITSTPVLEDPINRAGPVTFSYIFYAPAGAYLARLYIVYTAENPWEPAAMQGKEKYFEVPYLRNHIDRNNDLCTIIYPQMTKLNDALISNLRTGPAKVLSYSWNSLAYLESIAAIRRYNFNVRFKRVVIYLVQFDRPFYRYYSIINNFQDRLVVRLDEPDYTNISGASGLFASIRVDSAVWKLPEFIDLGRFDAAYCLQEAPLR